MDLSHEDLGQILELWGRQTMAQERIAQELTMIREALTRPPALSQEGALTRFADAIAKAQRAGQVASLWGRAEAGFDAVARGRAWAGAVARVRQIGSYKSADEAETALKRAIAPNVSKPPS